MTFAAVNIIEEVAKSYFNQVSMMNFHDLSSAMLVIAPKDEQLKPQALLWGQELVEVIGKTLKMNVTVMISHSTDSLHELPGIFVEMEQAVAYRSIEEGVRYSIWKMSSVFAGRKKRLIRWAWNVR